MCVCLCVRESVRAQAHASTRACTQVPGLRKQKCQTHFELTLQAAYIVSPRCGAGWSPDLCESSMHSYLSPNNLHFFIYAYVCRDGGGYIVQLACSSSFLWPHQTGGITQAVRLSGKSFYPWSHPAGPADNTLARLAWALYKDDWQLCGLFYIRRKKKKRLSPLPLWQHHTYTLVPFEPHFPIPLNIFPSHLRVFFLFICDETKAQVF